MQKSQVACSNRERMKERTREQGCYNSRMKTCSETTKLMVPATDVMQESKKKKFHYIMHYQGETLTLTSRTTEAEPQWITRRQNLPWSFFRNWSVATRFLKCYSTVAGFICFSIEKKNFSDGRCLLRGRLDYPLGKVCNYPRTSLSEELEAQGSTCGNVVI